MNKVERFCKRLWYKYLKPKPKLEPPPSMKDILNANFKKIQAGLDEYRITLDILTEDLQRKAKALEILTKAMGELNDKLESHINGD